MNGQQLAWQTFALRLWWRSAEQVRGYKRRGLADATVKWWRAESEGDKEGWQAVEYDRDRLVLLQLRQLGRLEPSALNADCPAAPSETESAPTYIGNLYSMRPPDKVTLHVVSCG